MRSRRSASCASGSPCASPSTTWCLAPGGGKFGPKARLCPTCHRQLHAMFSEKTLANELNSIERLRAEPGFAGYLKWASKQKDGATFRVRRSNAKR